MDIETLGEIQKPRVHLLCYVFNCKEILFLEFDSYFVYSKGELMEVIRNKEA